MALTLYCPRRICSRWFWAFWQFCFNWSRGLY